MTQHPLTPEQQARVYRQAERLGKVETRYWGCALAVVGGLLLAAVGVAIATFIVLS